MTGSRRPLRPSPPGSAADWLEALIAETDAIPRRTDRLRWLLGSVPTLIVVVAAIVARDPGAVLRGAAMKLVLVSLSTVNLLAGLGLVALWLGTARSDAIVVVLGLVLVTQGLFTIASLAGWLEFAQPYARHLLLIGSIAALVVGGIGFVVGAVTNLQPSNGDPEYGPMTVAFLLGLHGAAAVATTLAGQGRGALSPPHGG